MNVTGTSGTEPPKKPVPRPGPTVAVASIVAAGTVVDRVGSLVSAAVGLSEAPEEHAASEMVRDGSDGHVSERCAVFDMTFPLI